MSLHAIETHDARLVGAEALDALRAGLAQAGRATLLVPSFSQATDAQRQLADEPGLALGVTVTTPDAWVGERWEVWGDGRHMATARERVALMRLALGSGEGPVAGTAGALGALCRMAREAAPWMAEPGSAAWEALGEGDRAACLVIGRYLELLAERGLVERSEATASLGRALPWCPPLVLVGVPRPPRPLRELLQAVGEAGTEVTVVLDARGDAPAQAPADVRLLEAAGPLAEWELVAREARALADGGARLVVVAAADAGEAWRQLAPRLAARGLRATGAPRVPASKDAAVTAFLGFAEAVARIAELASTWPAPQEGPEGPVPQLGDMSWWPPRALTDFLLSDVSGVEAPRAWALDARWRGNRSLTPADVLAQLQRESLTSRAVAQATASVLRGRVGTAALQLARPLSEDGAHPAQVAALASVQDAARSLGALGIGAQEKGSITHRLPLTAVVSLLAEVLAHVTLGGHVALGPTDAPCEVRVCSRAEASELAPGSADALVACNLTAAEWPLAPEDGAAGDLLGALGMDEPEPPLVVARRQVRALMAASRGPVLLERCLHDASAQPTYPAVMLSELLESLPQDLPVPPRAALAEADVPALLAASGEGARPTGSLPTAPAGAVGAAARSMVVVPREGQAELPGGLPALSASQIETYLECPYKWFTLRRLGLEDQDATFSAVQEGSYAHRVLEVARRELAQRAAERAGLVAPGAPLSQAGDAVTFIPGAALSADTLPEARELVRAEMARHLAHQRMGATTLASQSLVPHTATEEYKLRLLERDLLSELSFELGRLAGFSPRHFELRFGGSRPGSAHVTYAGADFVGSIDRVDVDAHGRAVVIDYKHKGATGFAAEYDAFADESPAKAAALTLPRRVQSLIYAQVVRRMHPELKVVGAVYLSTRGGAHGRHEIAGMLDADAAEQVMGPGLTDARWGRLVAGGWGKASFPEVLDAVEAQVAERIARLVEGHIEAEPVDAHACSWCPVANCERRLS